MFWFGQELHEQESEEMQSVLVGLLEVHGPLELLHHTAVLQHLEGTVAPTPSETKASPHATTAIHSSCNAQSNTNGMSLVWTPGIRKAFCGIKS